MNKTTKIGLFLLAIAVVYFGPQMVLWPTVNTTASNMMAKVGLFPAYAIPAAMIAWIWIGSAGLWCYLVVRHPKVKNIPWVLALLFTALTIGLWIWLYMIHRPIPIELFDRNTGKPLARVTSANTLIYAPAEAPTGIYDPFTGEVATTVTTALAKKWVEEIKRPPNPLAGSSAPPPPPRFPWMRPGEEIIARVFFPVGDRSVQFSVPEEYRDKTLTLTWCDPLTYEKTPPGQYVACVVNSLGTRLEDGNGVKPVIVKKDGTKGTGISLSDGAVGWALNKPLYLVITKKPS